MWDFFLHPQLLVIKTFQRFIICCVIFFIINIQIEFSITILEFNDYIIWVLNPLKESWGSSRGNVGSSSIGVIILSREYLWDVFCDEILTSFKCEEMKWNPIQQYNKHKWNVTFVCVFNNIIILNKMVNIYYWRIYANTSWRDIYDEGNVVFLKHTKPNRTIKTWC